jgi:hypothetical protein
MIKNKELINQNFNHFDKKHYWRNLFVNNHITQMQKTFWMEMKKINYIHN